MQTKRTAASRASKLSSVTIILLALTLISFAPTYTTQAVDVFTDPVGFITLSIRGTNGLTPGVTSALSGLGLSMTQVVTNQGKVVSVNATNVTINGTVANDQFNGAAGEFYIEFTCGTNAGLIDDIADTVAPSTIITANNDSSMIAAGATYKIRKHWTLGSVFGPLNEAGLGGGISASAADNILVLDANSQVVRTYFYSTGGALGIGWRLQGAGAADQTNANLFIDQGIIIRRKQASSLSPKLVGAVKLGQTLVPIATTNNFIGNVYAADVTLTNSNLIESGLVGGLSASAADNVLILDPTAPAGNVFKTYFFSTGGPSGIGWRQQGQGATEAGNTPIPLGTSVVVQRKPPRAGFDWFARQTYGTNYPALPPACTP